MQCVHFMKYYYQKYQSFIIRLQTYEALYTYMILKQFIANIEYRLYNRQIYCHQML